MPVILYSVCSRILKACRHTILPHVTFVGLVAWRIVIFNQKTKWPFDVEYCVQMSVMLSHVISLLVSLGNGTRESSPIWEGRAGHTLCGFADLVCALDVSELIPSVTCSAFLFQSDFCQCVLAGVLPAVVAINRSRPAVGFLRRSSCWRARWPEGRPWDRAGMARVAFVRYHVRVAQCTEPCPPKGHALPQINKDQSRGNAVEITVHTVSLAPSIVSLTSVLHVEVPLWRVDMSWE